MGRPELDQDPRFSSMKTRAANMEAGDALVAEWTSQFGKEELFEMLSKARVPGAPVRELDEVMADPHLRARGMLQEVAHPEFGPMVLPRSPLRLHDVPPLDYVPSARLGAHNQEVWGSMLGADVDQLAKDQVI